MKRVCLHIGLHKTGTTAFQWHLRSSEERLRNLSVFYENHGNDMGRAIREKSPLSRASLARLRGNYWRKYSRLDEKFIIICAESFSGRVGSKGYEKTELMADNARYIFKDFDVKICAFVRRQDTFLESVYVHGLKNGGYMSWDEFRKEMDVYAFDWLELLGKYESRFGLENMVVFPYEELKRDNRKVTTEYFRGFGLDMSLDEGFALPRARPGLSDSGVEIVRRCYSILDGEERVRRERK